MNDASVKSRDASVPITTVDTAPASPAESVVSTETVQAQVTDLVKAGAASAINADDALLGTTFSPPTPAAESTAPSLPVAADVDTTPAAEETKASDGEPAPADLTSKPDAASTGAAQQTETQSGGNTVDTTSTEPQGGDIAKTDSAASLQHEVSGSEQAPVDMTQDLADFSEGSAEQTETQLGGKPVDTTATESQSGDNAPTDNAPKGLLALAAQAAFGFVQQLAGFSKKDAADDADKVPDGGGSGAPDSGSGSASGAKQKISDAEQAKIDLDKQLAGFSQDAVDNTNKVLYGDSDAPDSGDGSASGPERKISVAEQAKIDLDKQLAGFSQDAVDNTNKVLYGDSDTPGSGDGSTSVPERKISVAEQAKIDLDKQLAGFSQAAVDNTQAVLYGSSPTGGGSTPTPAPPQMSNAARAQMELQKMLAGMSAQMAVQTEQLLYANQAAINNPTAAKVPPTGAEVGAAAGAIAKYQSDNNVPLLSVNDMYALSRNPNVSAETRNAAKLMVENPNILRDIEVKGAPTPDQVTSVYEMQQTAAELAGDTKPYVPKASSPEIDATPTQANIANAANTLGKYMSDSGTQQLDATALNKLVYDPNVSEDTRKSAKFLLQNTEVYAAMVAQSAAAAPRPAPTRGEVAAAATTLGNYQNANGGVRTLDDYAKLSRDPAAPEDVRKAAKLMVENPDIYQDIEVGEWVGAWATPDGISSSYEMMLAANKLTTDADKPYVSTAKSVAIPSAPSAESTAFAISTLSNYMSAKGITEMNINDLNKLLYSPDATDDQKKAAKYMLQNSDVYASATNVPPTAPVTVASTSRLGTASLEAMAQINAIQEQMRLNALQRMTSI